MEAARLTFPFLRKAHADGVETAVDVQDLAGDSGGEVGAEECGGIANVFLGDIAPERGHFGNPVQHLAEPGDPCRSERLDRTRRDAVDPYSPRAQVSGQKADIGFEARLGETHDVVARDGPD